MSILLEPRLSVSGEIGVFRSDFSDFGHLLQIFHGPCSTLISQVEGSGKAECGTCGRTYYRSYLPTWDLRKSVDAHEIRAWVCNWTDIHPIEVKVSIGA